VRVVPNGIDTERFRPDPAARLRQRATWGVAADEPVVGLVGRLDPMKDHATAVRAAAALVAREPRLRLVFVGEGPAAYVNEVRALASSLGVGGLVTWAPATRDVAAVYNGFDVLALCSAFGEGFPNAVGEAMGCGVPCAVTDVGDAAWVVGDTGFVAPVGDAAAVARSWAAALDARRADPALGARCRARIVTEFSVPALVRRTLAALDGVMEAA
jgi:glycosyltransferase involved in cell wall biosynthesis